MVNIGWTDSKTRESWQRPLTASNKNTWYESSHFRGKYQIDKDPSPGFVTPPFILNPPGEVYQTGLPCWAAGSVSWLEGKKRPKTTVEE
jgi:hypothetical protein